MRIVHFLQLMGWIALSLAAGAIGSLATAGNVEGWYATLAKPAWNPPNWVFAPVWTTLYVLMGIAAFLVSRSGKPTRFLALWFFVLHLAVNAFWSIAFFGMHEILLALFVIGFLWLLVALLIGWFSRHSRAAAWLLAPYLAWVSFASTLNLAILLLN
jgi:tryptophan-rich sensory protein